MKATILAVVAALALAACGDDRIKPMSVGPNGDPATAAAPQAPGAQPAPQAQHADGGSSWFMPAAIGYLLGSMGNRSQPQVVQAPAAPSYTPPSSPRSSWWSRAKEKTAAAVTPSPTKPTPAPSKPPSFSTSPNSYSVPKPTAAPKPSYSGPSSYKSPSYSFKPSSPSYSSPSRSFSSGRR